MNGKNKYGGRKYIYGYTDVPDFSYSNCWYIGKQHQLTTIFMRGYSHYVNDDPMFRKAKYLLITPIPDVNDLDYIEKYLIEQNEPLLCTALKPVRGRKFAWGYPCPDDSVDMSQFPTYLFDISDFDEYDFRNFDIDKEIAALMRKDERYAKASHSDMSEDEILSSLPIDMFCKFKDEKVIGYNIEGTRVFDNYIKPSYVSSYHDDYNHRITFEVGGTSYIIGKVSHYYQKYAKVDVLKSFKGDVETEGDTYPVYLNLDSFEQIDEQTLTTTPVSRDNFSIDFGAIKSDYSVYILTGGGRNHQEGLNNACIKEVNLVHETCKEITAIYPEFARAFSPSLLKSRTFDQVLTDYIDPDYNDHWFIYFMVVLSNLINGHLFREDFYKYLPISVKKLLFDSIETIALKETSDYLDFSGYEYMSMDYGPPATKDDLIAYENIIDSELDSRIISNEGYIRKPIDAKLLNSRKDVARAIQILDSQRFLTDDVNLPPWLTAPKQICCI